MIRVLLAALFFLVASHVEASPARQYQIKPFECAQAVDATPKYSRLKDAQHAASWLRPPTKLPAGYVFDSAEIDGKAKEAWLRYKSEKNRFSIFQQHTREANNVEFRQEGEGWYWQDGKDRFLIAGLPEAQAKQVAESVK
jgi:hypothetical protein